MPFKPGVSGNPLGRPRVGSALAEYIRELGGPDGRVYVNALHEIATSRTKDLKSRLAAIVILLDRGFGRAAQMLEISAADDPKAVIPIEQLSDAELALLEKIYSGAVPTATVPTR